MCSGIDTGAVNHEVRTAIQPLLPLLPLSESARNVRCWQTFGGMTTTPNFVEILHLIMTLKRGVTVITQSRELVVSM
jgi:hypothetical protein